VAKKTTRHSDGSRTDRYSDGSMKATNKGGHVTGRTNLERKITRDVRDAFTRARKGKGLFGL
jgi:hypothetical protein